MLKHLTMATKHIFFERKKKHVILQVYHYLEKDSKKGSRFSVHQYFNNTKDIFDITQSTPRKLIKEKDKINDTNVETKQKSR